MISYFPSPYKDELYYSILARYHHHIGNTSRYQTMQELLGKYIKINFELPKGIDYLIPEAQLFSEHYTKNYFIDNHTIIPFVRPFKSKSWNKKLEDGFGRTSISLFRVKGEDVPLKEYLYYCSSCVDEQIQDHGETYWNRIHQIPGVYVCTKHKIALSEYPTKLTDLRRMNFVLPPKLQKNNSKITFKNETIEYLLRLAVDIEYILHKNFGYLSDEEFLQKYESLLGNKGLLYPFSMRKKKLTDMIMSNYPMEFLIILNSNINSWLPSMTAYEMCNLHPVRHILIMQLLCGSASNFFENEFLYEPFGKGPWICMNPLSNHYLEHVVKNMSINISKHDNGNFHGVMKCDCGYEYRLKEGESSPLEVKYFFLRVENRGETWNREFKKLIESNKTMKEIGEITKLSWDTIIRQKEEIYKISSNEETEFELKNEVVNKYRDKFLKLVNQTTGLSRTDIQNADRNTYYWLIRNDREWFESNAPEIKNKKGRKLKVDYSNDDNDLLEKASLLLINWATYENNLNKYVRKSKWKLLELLKIRKSDEYLKKRFPNTFKFIIENTETTDSFLVRKVNHSLETELKNEKLSVWNVISKLKFNIKVGSTRWKLIEDLIKVHNEKL